MANRRSESATWPLAWRWGLAVGLFAAIPALQRLAAPDTSLAAALFPAMVLAFALAAAWATGIVHLRAREPFSDHARRREMVLDSPLIGVSVARNATIIWPSPGLEAMMGYGPGELKGKPTRILHASDATYALAQQDHVPRAVAGETVTKEVRLLRKDGSLVWVYLSGTASKSAPGETVWVFTNITQQKAAEHALRVSQSLVTQKGALARVGGWQYDLRSGLIEWSDQTCRLHDVPVGYSPTLQEAIGFYAPEARPVMDRAVRAGIESGTPWDLELPLVSATGRRFWARAVGEAEFEDGVAVRLIGAFQDVTERRAMERDLARANELNRVALRSIIDAVIVLDKRGDVLWLNPSAERMTGWSLAVAVGRPMRDVCNLIDATTGQPSEPGEAAADQILVTGSGHSYAVEAVMAPMLDDARKPIGKVLTLHDVTKQRHLDQALREREQTYAGALARLDIVFKNSPDAMVLCRRRPDGRFAYEAVNPRWEQATGIAADTAVGRLPEECLPPDVAATVNAICKECARTMEAKRYTFEIAGGTWDCYAVPIAGPDGSVERILCHARDITAQRNLEASLQQMQRMEAVGQLTAGVAHDFNNLLQAITGCLGILRDNGKLDIVSQDLIGIAEDAAQSGATLVHRLLAFSRKQALDPATLWPVIVFSHLTMLLGTTLRADIRVEVEVEPDCWPLRADATQLENCLLNLALNARDAMPDGGILFLQASKASAAIAGEQGLPIGEYVRLSVCDSGTGMAPEVLSRAMEPFFTTKGVGKGTGLGLSMVAGFARQSGGDLRIVSVPNCGTTVHMFLPRSMETSSGQSVDMPGQGEMPAARPNVLVVDDDSRVCRMLSAALAKGGFNAVPRDSGYAALAYLREGGPCDMLVTDQSMPGMTGTELIEVASALRPALPLMLVTGHDMVQGADRLPARVTVLRKPFRHALFLDHVRAMLTVWPNAEPDRQALR